MVAQSPPYAVQNGSHSAQLFRMAAFSPWRQSGAVGISDFPLTPQGTPNMSIIVGAGRAWLKGTQIASVVGGSWTPQGGYYGFNDAPVTLTIAAADPTNPRIDAVVAYATDAFYSGSTNTFVLGIVTGTPAATPATPAVPNNGLLLGTVAVAANATSIGSGNISAVAALMGVTRGGVQPVTSADVTAGDYVDQYRGHPTNGLERWDGSKWSTPLPLGAWVTDLTSTSYTTTPGASWADLISNSFTVTVPAGRTLDVEVKVPYLSANANGQIDLRLVVGGTVVDTAQCITGSVGIVVPAKLTGGVVGTGASVTFSVQGITAGAGGIVWAGNQGGSYIVRHRFL